MVEIEIFFLRAYDQYIQAKLKENFYGGNDTLAMIHGVEYWAIRKQHVHKMSIVGMRTLR